MNARFLDNYATIIITLLLVLRTNVYVVDVEDEIHFLSDCPKYSPIKVIPLKLLYYQTVFETWHNEHS